MTRLEEFVSRYREHTPEIDDEVDVFLAWLEDNGPDEWHRWAINWNWDHGTELFWWIVTQPNCDRGTALSIYYAAQPDAFGRYASIEDARANTADIGDDVIGLMIHICQMWAQGAYPSYAYQPSWAALTYLDQGEEAMRAIAASVPWEVPDDLAAAGIHGEPNNFERTIDGIPVEMLRALGENW